MQVLCNLNCNDCQIIRIKWDDINIYSFYAESIISLSINFFHLSTVFTVDWCIILNFCIVLYQHSCYQYQVIPFQKNARQHISQEESYFWEQHKQCQQKIKNRHKSNSRTTISRFFGCKHLFTLQLKDCCRRESTSKCRICLDQMALYSMFVWTGSILSARPTGRTLLIIIIIIILLYPGVSVLLYRTWARIQGLQKILLAPRLFSWCHREATTSKTTQHSTYWKSSSSTLPRTSTRWSDLAGCWSPQNTRDLCTLSFNFYTRKVSYRTLSSILSTQDHMGWSHSRLSMYLSKLSSVTTYELWMVLHSCGNLSSVQMKTLDDDSTDDNLVKMFKLVLFH